MKILFFCISLFCALTEVISGLACAAGIAATKHNLSSKGPGPVRALSEARVCVFCHTPHLAVETSSLPLWNRTLSRAVYQVFDSPTLLSRGRQPDGVSRACLSCHDGTVALGSVVNTGASRNAIYLQGTGAGGIIPAGPALLGTNLSGHHPVSVEINSFVIQSKHRQAQEGAVSFKVCAPFAGSPVRLSRTGSLPGAVGVQCTSCHDPHEDPDPGRTVFLRTGDRNDFDALCLSCHRDDSDACL